MKRSLTTRLAFISFLAVLGHQALEAAAPPSKVKLVIGRPFPDAQLTAPKNIRLLPGRTHDIDIGPARTITVYYPRRQARQTFKIPADARVFILRSAPGEIIPYATAEKVGVKEIRGEAKVFIRKPVPKHIRERVEKLKDPIKLVGQAEIYSQWHIDKLLKANDFFEKVIISKEASDELTTLGTLLNNLAKKIANTLELGEPEKTDISTLRNKLKEARSKIDNAYKAIKGKVSQDQFNKFYLEFFKDPDVPSKPPMDIATLRKYLKVLETKASEYIKGEIEARRAKKAKAAAEAEPPLEQPPSE